MTCSTYSPVLDDVRRGKSIGEALDARATRDSTKNAALAYIIEAYDASHSADPRDVVADAYRACRKACD